MAIIGVSLTQYFRDNKESNKQHANSSNYDVIQIRFLTEISRFCQNYTEFYRTIMAGSDHDILETHIFMHM